MERTMMWANLINRADNNNMTQAVAAAASKVTAASAASTITIAATLDAPHLLGYSIEQWQIIGIITGITTGVLGLIITAIFHYLNYQLKVRQTVSED